MSFAEQNLVARLELLLCRPNGVLPFFAVSLAVYHPVDRVVTQIRVDMPHEWLQLFRRQRAVAME